MSALKERAVRIIEALPDNKIQYVISYLNELENERDTDDVEREAAKKWLLSLDPNVPEDFDADEEMRLTREGKYGNID